MKKILASIFLCLLSGICVIGQSKIISSDEFFQPIRNFYQIRKKVSYRESSKVETLRDGKTIRTKTGTIEYSNSETMRFLYTIETDENTIRYESIKIDGSYYCKKNQENWKITKSLCGGGGIGGGSQNPVYELFSLENADLDGRTVKLYSHYVEYRGYKPTEEKVYFSDRKYWLDEKGLILREEINSGRTKPEKVTTTKTTKLYKYNPYIFIIKPKINKDNQDKN